MTLFIYLFIYWLIVWLKCTWTESIHGSLDEHDAHLEQDEQEMELGQFLNSDTKMSIKRQ